MARQMVRINKIGEWNQLSFVFSQMNIDNMREEFDKELERQANELAETIRAVYQGRKRVPGITHKRLHPWTAALKGDSKMFEDNGYLADAVQVEKHGFAHYSVQIDPLARTDNQWEYWKVAQVLEKGTQIAISQAMRNWFHAQGLHLKATTKVIVIPARPIWKPLFKLMVKQMPKRFENMIRDRLGGY